jgi:hypothetical protein
MPVSLDNSRAFTDYRSSRRVSQDLINQCQDQAVGVCLTYKSYTKLPNPSADALLINEISTYEPEYMRRPRE